MNEIFNMIFIVNFSKDHISNKDKYYVDSLSKKYQLIDNVIDLVRIIKTTSKCLFILQCVFYDQYHQIYINLNRLNLKNNTFYIFVDDLHNLFYGHKQIFDFYLKLGSKIFCTYKYNMIHLQYQKYVDKTVWLPHYANPDFIIDNDNIKINKILLSGNTNELYDFRNILASHKNNDIYILPHAGWNKKSYENDIVGTKYGKYINKYKCCFVDCGVPYRSEGTKSYNKSKRYVVAKIFEIALCKSLLLIDERIKLILYNLGFVEDNHYISCSYYNYQQKIKWILDIDNENQINNIIDNAFNLVTNCHLLGNRLELISVNIDSVDVINKYQCDKIITCPNIYYTDKKLENAFNMFSCFKRFVDDSKIYELFTDDELSDEIIVTHNDIPTNWLDNSISNIISGLNFDVIYFINNSGKLTKNDVPKKYLFYVIKKSFLNVDNKNTYCYE